MMPPWLQWALVGAVVALTAACAWLVWQVLVLIAWSNFLAAACEAGSEGERGGCGQR